MRVSAAQFFYSEHGGLAVGDLNELVLNCYRLARWYHQAPTVFLEMSITEVRMHMERTLEVKRLMEQAATDESDDG